MHRHWVALALLALLALFPHIPSLGGDFCGYDDFSEVGRAAFDDAENPEDIFTTSHFDTPRYRPLNRLLTYVTWHYGGKSALTFRWRNVLTHIGSAFALYGIAWLWLGQRRAAFFAGLFFAVHPLAHQPVSAAAWGNTTAYLLAFTAYFLFVYSLYRPQRWKAALIACFVVTFITLLSYESCIVLFGFFLVTLAIRLYRGQQLPQGFLLIMGIGMGFNTLLLFIVRRMFVTSSMPLTPPALMVKNLVMYLGALASPLDLLTLSTHFGTPLPSELKLSSSFLLQLGVGGALIAAVLAGLLFGLSAMRNRWRRVDWLQVCGCIVCIVASLLPFLIFTSHVSETYLYAACGFAGLIMAMLLWQWLPTRAATAVAVLWIGLFLFGSWTRSTQVDRCSTTVSSILSGLPIDQWRQGEWLVVLATPEDDPLPKPFGLYNYFGLNTMEVPGVGFSSAERAVQLATGNDAVHVKVVDAASLPACPTCYWVSSQGVVKASSAQ
jgi:hypothetical protein